MITCTSLGRYGRLGNQMFQIAAVIGSARKQSNIAVFPKWHCTYTNKDMSVYFENKIKQDFVLVRSLFEYEEPYFQYAEIPNMNDVNIRGYFQSEKYFQHCPELIRRYFQPSSEMLEKIKSKYKKYINGSSCAIHVRRGDYVGNYFHEVCSMKYYNDAILEVKNKTNVDFFLVFSDDIDWCKQNFPVDFVFIEDNFDTEDLFLMSMCKHNIIANSSMSWWGSWLNANPDKIIIVPNKWFGPKCTLNDVDIYTKNMIRL